LNPRPSISQTAALPAELHPPTILRGIIMEKGIELENTEIYTLLYDMMLAKKKKIIQRYKCDIFIVGRSIVDANPQKYLPSIYGVPNTISVLAKERYYYLKKYQTNLNDKNECIQKKTCSGFFQQNNADKYEKEKSLFLEHEALRAQLLNFIAHNIPALMSLVPTTKYLRKIRKEPKLLKRYFIDTKSLDKVFASVNPAPANDSKILEIIQNSRPRFLSKKMSSRISTNSDVISIPYIILRETTKIVNSIEYMHHIECITDGISKDLKKCYIDTKWDSIFLNKVSRSMLPLTEFILEELDIYYSKISNNTLYNVLYGITAEYVYINALANQWVCAQIQDGCSINNSTINISSASYTKVDKTLYINMYLILYNERIQIMHKRRIVDYYMPYISMMSKQYMKNGYGIRTSDLIQEGTLGIMDAIDRFQIGRGVRFLTYAYWWMHRYMVKIRIKKTKAVTVRVKPDAQIKTQSKLIARIKMLYDKIMKKEKKKKNAAKKRMRYRDQIYYMLHIKKNMTEHRALDVYARLYPSLTYKDFVVCSLYFGIPPYRKHKIIQISSIFDITEKEVFKYIKKAQKRVVKAYKRASRARL
jgi:RNA polymerase sigma factor (sigma-70 family)